MAGFYPPIPKNLCPGNYETYAAIRKRFGMPHDRLRHTAITAFVAKHGAIALAAQEFGSSETIIKKHYLPRMSADETEAFYSIVPRHVPAKLGK